MGGAAVLFPERVTSDLLFRPIERFRPTILVNVPTMVQRMVDDAEAAARPPDLSSLRVATSAGEVVPGFEVRVCDEAGRPVPDGEVGFLWVRGDSRAIQDWQRMDRTKEAFRGEWYVSGDMISRSADGYFTYHGRGDDMLKVKGKWLAPGEVENRLLQHTAVREAAVVGVKSDDGLESYRVPARIHFMDELPRTHLGKVDRGALRGVG